MRPERPGRLQRRCAARQRCRGFSAIAAIAILVILSVLGAFIVTVSTLQSQSSALDVLGSRAYQAAKAGTEWGAYNILNPEIPPGTARYTVCDGGTTATFSGLGGGLGEFTVTVSCQMSSYTEFGNTLRVYQLTSTACNMQSASCPNAAPSGASYVERQIVSIVATCRQNSAVNAPIC
jgi:MSHA biogenesis protein MshP